jgi:hypothetical protein
MMDLLLFKQRVEGRTKRAVKVQIFDKSQFTNDYNDYQVSDAVGSGAIEMGVAPLGQYENEVGCGGVSPAVSVQFRCDHPCGRRARQVILACRQAWAAGRQACVGELRMRKTLVNCRALLGEGQALADGALDIVIDGRLITDIRPHGAVEPEGLAIDMSRRLVAPGLINGHHHSHEGYYKGRKDNLPLELWMNYVRPLQPSLSPRDVYLRTMVSAIEAVKSGTTTICDDLNASPRLIPEHIEAAYQAYEDLGIRANVGITLFDNHSSAHCLLSMTSSRRSYSPSWTQCGCPP